MSQENLASLIGKHHSAIVRAESGEQGMDDETFAEIARIYGISTAELSAPPSDQPRAKLLHQVLTLIRDLDEKGLEAVATLAERVAPRK